MYTEDGQFDYRTLHRDQLEYAIEHIDPQAFPKNLANARAALAARQSGDSAEPPPLLDPQMDARYSLWVERALGMIVALYASITLAKNDLVIPLPSRSLEGSTGRIRPGCGPNSGYYLGWRWFSLSSPCLFRSF